MRTDLLLKPVWRCLMLAVISLMVLLPTKVNG